jgi:DNA-binding response OmpR family regulator
MAATDFAAAVGTVALGSAFDPQPLTSFDCALGPDRQIRVLSVSPDEGDHTALLQILDQLPFVVSVAHSSQEAALCLNLEQFGIILCECNLPDGNWLDVLNRISGVAENPLLIVTSRLADVSLWAEVLNLGGYDLLAKPFSPPEVQHVLTSAWVQRANPVPRRSVAGAA